MTNAAHVAVTAMVWMLLLSSLRFAAVGSSALVPLGSSAWGVLWCKGSDNEQCLAKFNERLDAVYIRLLMALTTPASATLVYAAMAMIGAGCMIGSFGNVLRFVSPHPERWADTAMAMTCTGIPLIVVGMSCLVAAVSPRRTASLIMSAGFILSGVGVGVVTATMVHHA